MVFQFVSLYPHLNIKENIVFPLKARGVAKAEIARKLDWVTDIFKLGDELRRYPGALPPGARQKVALARAVIRDPAVLLLDEPLSAIDEQFREEMRWELGHLQRQLGVTTIYVTHDQREAMSLADRIVLMNDSRIVQVSAARPHVLRSGQRLCRPVHRLAVDEPDRPRAGRGRAQAGRQRGHADARTRPAAGVGAGIEAAAQAWRPSAQRAPRPTIRQRVSRCRSTTSSRSAANASSRSASATASTRAWTSGRRRPDRPDACISSRKVCSSSMPLPDGASMRRWRHECGADADAARDCASPIVANPRCAAWTSPSTTTKSLPCSGRPAPARARPCCRLPG